MRVLIKPQISCRWYFCRNLILVGEASSTNSAVYSYNELKAASLLNHESFTQCFKACANFQLWKEGTLAHADAIKTGFDSYISTNNSIMSFYFKVGMKNCALNVFDQMPKKDSISWNSVIYGFLSQKDPQLGLILFTEAITSLFVPNVSTLVLVLQACWILKALPEGKNIQGFIIKTGHTTDSSVQNSLLSFYGKLRDVESAQKLFDEMGEKDIISWSSLISSYSQSGDAITALQLFHTLFAENGIKMDGLVLVSVLQACSSLGYANHGKLVHSLVISIGFESCLLISNSLIDMYSKCLDMESAYKAFTQILQPNMVSWNSVFSGFVENERCMEALLMFESMKRADIEGDSFTLSILLKACRKLGQGTFCKSIHSVLIRKQFEASNFVLNSLLDAYAKCGLMGLALKLFGEMPNRDVITWSIMISGFSNCGEPHKAVKFFVFMRLSHVAPNSVTMLSLLDACSTIANLKLVKCANGVVVKFNLSKDISVSTALLGAYAKCGNLDMARILFGEMSGKNILSWNAMIRAFGMNGCAREAIATLNEMATQNLKPDGVTMLSALSACSHGGLTLEGLSLFQRMVEDDSVQPSLEHYSCIVDLLARAGDLKNGFEVIRKLCKQGVDVYGAAWGALLSASSRFGYHEIGQIVARNVLELEPLSSAGYMLSSNMYAKAGLRDESARFRLLMKERGVRVVSGYSLVYAGEYAKRFVAWDESDPRSDEIKSMAGFLNRCIQRYDENDLF